MCPLSIGYFIISILCLPCLEMQKKIKKLPHSVEVSQQYPICVNSCPTLNVRKKMKNNYKAAEIGDLFYNKKHFDTGYEKLVDINIRIRLDLLDPAPFHDSFRGGKSRPKSWKFHIKINQNFRIS